MKRKSISRQIIRASERITKEANAIQDLDELAETVSSDMATIVSGLAGVNHKPLETLEDVVCKEISWLWDNRFALGKISLIAGDPGLGKSFATLSMAAMLSSGSPWPDQIGNYQQPASTLLLSAEDDIADTIKPRLVAMGADCRKIVCPEWEKSFTLDKHLPKLDKAIDSMGDCRLVIIDPINRLSGQNGFP